MKDAAIITGRYAETLFNLCLKERNLEAVDQAFAALVHETGKNPDFARYMESPVIPRKNKEALLEKTVSPNIPNLLNLFLRLVLIKKRFALLHAIQICFRQRVETSRGIHKAELITAVPIEDTTQAKLRAILERKLAAQKDSSAEHPGRVATVEIAATVDKKILGGFILKMDERIVDASYKTKLQEVKQRLYAAAL